MAKLRSYYTLCPLIDQQNLLGVERDSESGCAIVTLGRNIVIRYKLQDVKQLSSWTSKDRLTAQVIYDETLHRYAAIFNEKKIRLWSENESDLNNVKSYKFQSPLHTILTSEDSASIVVRQNGSTASLEWALENRKSWPDMGILKPKEKILDCRLIRANDKTSLCLLTEIDGTYNCTVVKLDDTTYVEEVDHLRRIELKRRSEDLVGHAFMRNKNNGYLLTLWSHGRLYSHSLTETCTDSGTSTLIGIINTINTKHPVVMVPLNETTVAVYGADVSEEGAVLMIYNVQFKLVQAAQKLKLYTKDAKLWKIEDKLLLAANRHLAIAPYHLAPQRISALLGSSLSFKKKDGVNEDDDEIVVIQESTIAKWDNSKLTDKQLLEKPPAHLSKQISVALNEGLSDATIQEILIPQLIESKDVLAIVWSLATFKDLPEKLLIDLLAFALRSSDETFLILDNGATDDDEVPEQYTRNDFLDKIFSVAYSDVFLSSYLKVGLSFDEVLRLLRYLVHKLDDQSDFFENIREKPTDKQLYEWSSLLLDSHYQHYVLSRDSEVSMLLQKLNSVLEDHLRLFRDLEKLRPILSRTINGKSSKLSPKHCNKFYAIEEIKLY